MELNIIKSMERIARADERIVSLGQGIPSKPTPVRLHRAAERAIRQGLVDKYLDPQGLLELREAISKRVKRQGMRYDADEIIITTGAIEALCVALKSMIKPGTSEIIVPTPVYSAYFKCIEQANGKVVEVPLADSDGWQLQSELLIQRFTKRTAAILLCSPNNPTGTVYEKEVLDEIVAAAAVRGIPVILDEVYSNLVYDKQHYSPAMNGHFKDWIIRIMSFSKDFSMTGWRVGYIQASKQRIDEMIGYHDTFVNCAPVISQYVALEAMQIYDQVTIENRDMYRTKRSLMCDYLDQIEGISYVIPQGGYCLFVRLHGRSSLKLATHLAHKGVVTIPGYAFGQGCDEYLRLCFGRSDKAIHTGMQVIARELATI